MALRIPVHKKEGVQRTFSYTITDAGREIRAFPFKWFQVTVTNDDEGTDEPGNDLYVIINDQPRTNPVIVKAGEPYEFDYDEPTIWRVVLWTDAGLTAAARIDTVR